MRSRWRGQFEFAGLLAALALAGLATCVIPPRTVLSNAAPRVVAYPTRTMGTYACRPMNGVSGNKLSEHGHANALDISGFHLADGRLLTVKSGWQGGAGEREFLRTVHRGACGLFTTVLGPNSNSYHADHFHLDLARHGKDGNHRVCE